MQTNTRNTEPERLKSELGGKITFWGGGANTQQVLPRGTLAEVVAMGQGLGYSQATLYRARRGLGERVVDTRGRQHPHNQWALVDAADEQGDETC